MSKEISGIQECVKALSEKRKCSLAQAREIINDVLDVMEDEIMRTGGVQFVGRFALKTQSRAERDGRNPSTGEKISIPARNTLKLTIGSLLKDKLNQ